MSTAIVWLRQDLRLTDNPALWNATQRYAHVIPIYILDENYSRPMGGASRWWLHQSLTELSHTFSKHKVTLLLKRGQVLAVLKKLCQETSADALFFNRVYEPMAMQNDKTIEEHFTQQGMRVESFNSFLLVEPWQISNQSGDYFKVYMPFWKTLCSQLQPRDLYPTPSFTQSKYTNADQLSDWALEPHKPDWSSGIRKAWKVGEQAAQKKLEEFIDAALEYYATDRDRPDRHGTSRLSAHLHFGEISPNQIWHAISQAGTACAKLTVSVERYLAEIGWREFSYHLLYHFPQLPTKNFKAQFKQFPWSNSKKALYAWQQGKTGYPIVDAGMRELWETGYMHNRVRMIVASFLTKDLLIDWRKGEAWFWDTLVDADIANNSASWQWVAGCGADAAPYFRIFNPVLQGEKFDPNGEYVKRWIPELQAVPQKFIHKPWEIENSNTLKYPKPIVDHAAARNCALKAYQKIREKHPNKG